MIIAIILVILLIFPIFVNVKLYISNEDKLYFCFKLFSFIRIIFGEIIANSNGLIINLNYKKIIIYKYKKFLNIKESIKPLRDYHLLNCNININFGVTDLEKGVIVASVFQIISEMIYSSLRELKPYVKLKSKLNIYENTREKNAFVSLNFVFNLLTVLLGLFKKLLGKLISWKEKVTD